MKRLQTILAVLTLTVLGCTPGTPKTQSSDAFITVWTTNMPGSGVNTKQITLPLLSSGEYDFVVTWGDGTKNHVTSYYGREHTYKKEGTYTVNIVGKLIGWSFGLGSMKTKHQEASKLVHIVQWGSMLLGATKFQFMGCKYLTILAKDAPDLSRTVSLLSAFAGATAFNGDLSHWDVSKVENMSYMFARTMVFNGDISTWNTSNVKDMPWMFYKATSFNQNISSWDVSKVKDMSGMFSKATAFNQNISTWTTSNVRNMAIMFREATTFNQNISSWDVSKVEDMTSMFLSAKSFNQNLSQWDTCSVKNMSDMFAEATAMEEVNKPVPKCTDN